MKDFLTKFKIPTLLGLGIIISGIAAGAFLVLREQNIISKASSDVSAQNITLANLSDDSVTISWQTSTPISSFITLGLENPSGTTILDDRDKNGPKAHLMHYVTIKNLLPKTTYQYKIVSGKSFSDILNFTTTAPLNFQSVLQPIIGSVFDGDKPLEEAIVYLSIADTTTQSSLIKVEGNFLIPMSQIRVASESIAKLTILSPKGQATALFKVGDFERGLPPIALGENLDLTVQVEDPTKYDLNNDGRVNSADNALILQNLGKNPKNPKADLNADGMVDQKDLSEMSKRITEQKR